MTFREELSAFGLALAVVSIIVVIGMLTMPTKTEAGPVKEAVTAEYKIGRTTIYEWRTGHNRLCTMVVDQYSSNAPFINCS